MSRALFKDYLYEQSMRHTVKNAVQGLDGVTFDEGQDRIEVNLEAFKQHMGR